MYRRGEQTPEAAEYRWGTSEEDLGSGVVLEPRDPAAWPTVGGEDALMPMVVRAVLGRQRATGTWPERGVVQH